MGLFDSLKKLSKDIINNIPEEVKNGINTIQNGGNTNGSKEISAEYAGFPTFEDNVRNITEKMEPSYRRCTMDYKNVSEEDAQNYISRVISLGYTKATKVRYDKSNTYIIIERNGSNLHLVFHIKG